MITVLPSGSIGVRQENMVNEMVDESRTDGNVGINIHAASAALRFLLVGPCDPNGGEYTFLAPPLGVWRLAGFLRKQGLVAEVFDPNLYPDTAIEDFQRLVSEKWDVIGISTTGMTLRYDLQLAHIARAGSQALIVAGGMEATFNPERLFKLAPIDLIVLGEGEHTLLTLANRLRAGNTIEAIPGTAQRMADGKVHRFHANAMSTAELREAIYATPYADMPYEAYWEKLERAYRVGELPFKADREARLAEIRSVRLITLNYCPMGCSFCSSTNFLHEAQGSHARIARLDAAECLQMIQKIIATHPTTRTVIFQDDIFVFTADKRIVPLCEAIIAAKERGDIPRELQFISTNRIDAMNAERLSLMRLAGFRVLGFGVENFSVKVLDEFNKKRIYPHIEPMLSEALRLGITPFLDLILTSPRSTLADLAETIRCAYHWLMRGCEIGMYPYVIPFSGAPMASDAALEPHTVFETCRVHGTGVAWQQPVKILPIDPITRKAICAIEARFETDRGALEAQAAHLPSRLRSLLWIAAAIPVLRALGEDMPDEATVILELRARLPVQKVVQAWLPQQSARTTHHFVYASAAS